MNKTHRLLLADDHRIVLDGLDFLLSADPEIQVVGKVENGVEVLNFLDSHRVDVVVMDINMPEMDGITCAKRIKAERPHIKIIILTQYAQKTFITELATLVEGCLLKSNTGLQLTKAVHRVMGDERHFDDFPEDEVSSEILGKREVEILQLISEGLTSAEISERLFISVHTVKTHRKNILKKSGQTNTPDLIAWAMNQGVL